MYQNDVSRELETMGSKLAGLSRSMPYILPEGYFDRLTEEVFNVATNNSGSFPEKKEIPYQVPADYFEQFPGQLLEKVRNRESSRIFHFPGRMLRAAAALLVIASGTGIYFSLNRTDNFNRQLSSLPDEAVTEYLVQTSPDLSVDQNTVSLQRTIRTQLTEEEIIRYLDETGWQ